MGIGINLVPTDVKAVSFFFSQIEEQQPRAAPGNAGKSLRGNRVKAENIKGIQGVDVRWGELEATEPSF